MEHGSERARDKKVTVNFLNRARIGEVHHQPDNEQMTDQTAEDEHYPRVSPTYPLMPHMKHRQGCQCEREAI